MTFETTIYTSHGITFPYTIKRELFWTQEDKKIDEFFQNMENFYGEGAACRRNLNTRARTRFLPIEDYTKSKYRWCLEYKLNITYFIFKNEEDLFYAKLLFS